MAMDPTAQARLEAHILGCLELGLEVHVGDLRREFPGADDAQLAGALGTCQALRAWLEELRRVEERSEPDPGREDWLATGERLGGYVILRRIPGGGMGQVYQAIQEALHPRRVALKVHRLGERPEKELRRARREAEVASRLVHPHLVAVHDMGQDLARGLAWFSMQYVDGPDLRSELLAGAAPRDAAAVRRLVARVSEIAGALAELHGRGYVHRDVKPENILLRQNAGRGGRDEAAVLVDFGLVRAERALRPGGVAAAGTQGYAPPEAERPGSAVTPAWDVYSLGVVLYELLANRLLAQDPCARLPGPSELAALRAALPAVDADLEAVLRRATALEPGQRYPHAGELESELESWLAGRGVRARRPPLLERTVRGARRQPRRALLLATCAVLVPFCLWVLADGVGEVRAARRALGRGELLAGWERLESVRLSALRGLLLDQPELQRDLRDGVNRHAISQVVRVQREQGQAAAFELATAFLARGGLAHQPELSAYLLRVLGRSESGPVRALALRAAARLFYEQPIRDPGSLALARPFTACATRILGAQDATRDERLHAACVIGGAGDPEELEGVLNWMRASARDVEVQRLGLRTCERLVRRLRLVEPDPARWGAAWRALEEPLAALLLDLTELARTDPDMGALEGGVQSFLVAWTLLRRAAGRPSGVVDGAAARLGPAARLALRAAQGGQASAELEGDILSWAQGELDAGRFSPPAGGFRFGVPAGYAGSLSLRHSIEALLAGQPALTKSFREGLEAARIEIEQGIDVTQAPHPTSLLVRRFDEVPRARTLELEHLAQRELGPEILAHWRFFPACLRAGRAGSPTLGGGAYWHAGTSNNHDHLRLPRPGAWVEFAFDVEPPVSPYVWHFELEQLAATRSYLPFQGQAWIGITLNGSSIAERLLVDFIGGHGLRFPIEGLLLAPGANRLRIELVDATTTYWIHHLSIERRAP